MINMLIGNYRLNIKCSNLKIPRKILAEFNNSIYIGINGEHIIYIIDSMQLEEFSKHEDLLKFKSLLSTTIDEFGNLNIPINFLQHAYIDDNCIMIGVGDHAELWNPILWNQFEEDFELHKNEYLKVLDDIVL